MRSNSRQIANEILSNPRLIKEAMEMANDILENNKRELINEFNQHPVTKEIEAGPSANNMSGTLGGRGNLFSFIGFNIGDNPIEPIRSMLKSIKLNSSSGKISGNKIEFKVIMPEDSEFESASKMPWESGRSWLYDIERSISGLSNYLYGKFFNSRSESGIQSEKNVNSATFRSVKYFASMMAKFKAKLK